MVESTETLSDETSDIYKATSSEYSTSSESSSKETTSDNSASSSNRGKGKAKKKEGSSTTTEVTHPQAKKCRKQETAMLSGKEMEELSAWI